jgi:uncharacterized protein DUF937
MAGLLEEIFGADTDTVEQVQRHTGNDRDKAEQAYGAAVGTILRGVEKKSQTKEGAESMFDMIRKQVEQGNIPAEGPGKGTRVQTRELDSKTANDMMKSIFGENAPNVDGGFAKVIKLDPETSKQIFAKVLPMVLGSLFGAAQKDPEESPKALPKVAAKARNEMEQQNPRTAGIFDAILDIDHDGDVDIADLAGFFARKPK